jgi:hypothetical protein
MDYPLIYVYCLSDSQPELTHYKEVEGLKSLRFDDLFAVIKYVSEIDFSEENFQKHLSDISWLENNAREHVEVITRIMENHSVIPFKFGTIFQEETGLKKFVADYAESLTENFLHIGGREEWAVKIYCDRNSLSDKIDELSEEAASLEIQIMASSPGKAYLLKRKKDDLIENEMDRICKKYGQEYFDELNSLSEANRLNNLLPKEFTGREDTMILNATFLISKSKVANFKNTVDRLGKKDENFGFLLECTGPWPPFSFIYIKEKQQ